MKRSLRSWLWRVPVDREVDEEIDFHIEMRTRELVERGLDPKTARAIVLRRLGDVGQLKRTCIDLGRKREREMRLTQWLEEMRADVGYAFRQMKASPGFSTVAVLTLALGIGANSAIFALADAAFFRPLPFTAPADRLMMLWERFPNGGRTQVTPPDYNDWAAQNTTFESMAAFVPQGVAMTGPDGNAEQVQSQSATVRFFDVLGVTPIAGRTFLPSDTVAPSVVVLAEGFWRRRFGADPSLVGRSISVDGRPQTVIGIVPNRFQVVPATLSNAGSRPPDLWVLFNTPLGENPGMRRAHYLQVVGRLKAGVSFDAAQQEMTAIGIRNAERFPDTNKGHDPSLQPIREALVGSEIRLTSMLLLGIVGFVLLMCCANVANLLLARLSARARELAVRSALGATRRRIVTQLLTESLLLSAIGGLLGIAVGAGLLQLAPSIVPPGLLPNAVALTFDARVAAFGAGAALVVGIFFGLAPARQSTGLAMMQVIGAEGRAVTRGGRLRNVLVVAEIAAAVLVLSGAGLLLRTLIAQQRMDPGNRARDVLTMVVNLPMPGPNSASRYGSPESLRQFYSAVEPAVRQAPGVREVGLGTSLPLDGMWFGQVFTIAGDPPKLNANPDAASYHIVGPSYFRTLDIPLVRGRGFAETDTGTSLPVCIVSEAFVRRFLGARDPIGMRLVVPAISLVSTSPVARQIVGVVRQVKSFPNEPEPVPQLYVPIAQNPWYMASISVRPAAGTAASLVPAVRAAIAGVDKDLPVARIRTLDVIALEATARPRFRAVLVGAFAALALVLAMVGVFGVLAFSVQQRLREFGIRIAMGARTADVLRLVLGSAARLTLIGLAIGLAAAAGLSRWLATLVYPVSPRDPITFALVPFVILITAAVAVAAPAIRAMRVDPGVAFRNE